MSRKILMRELREYKRNCDDHGDTHNSLCVSIELELFELALDEWMSSGAASCEIELDKKLVDAQREELIELTETIECHHCNSVHFIIKGPFDDAPECCENCLEELPTDDDGDDDGEEEGEAA